jgi:hypothetical protein
MDRCCGRDRAHERRVDDVRRQIPAQLLSPPRPSAIRRANARRKDKVALVVDAKVAVGREATTRETGAVPLARRVRIPGIAFLLRTRQSPDVRRSDWMAR